MRANGGSRRHGNPSDDSAHLRSRVPSEARVLIIAQNYTSSAALAQVVKNAGYRSATFESAFELLASPYLHQPCCVLLESNSIQQISFDLHKDFARRFEFVPVIVLSQDSSLKAGLAAMKAGAVDYLVQPVDQTVIANAINTALTKQAKTAEFNKCSVKFRQSWQRLTSREREVLSFIINGYLNKQIAAELGISEKTVKVHRGRVMKKMQVASFAELVRLAERASIAENLSSDDLNGYGNGILEPQLAGNCLR